MTGVEFTSAVVVKVAEVGDHDVPMVLTARQRKK